MFELPLRHWVLKERLKRILHAIKKLGWGINQKGVAEQFILFVKINYFIYIVAGLIVYTSHFATF